MREFSFDFPDGYDEIEGIIESKGWLNGTLHVSGKTFDVYFACPERLVQDAAEELQTRPFWFEPNLILIPMVTRKCILDAVRGVVDSGIEDQLLPRMLTNKDGN